jgi:VIT1/CCC1 family predicted Fe2+/Mn2+ transporter
MAEAGTGAGLAGMVGWWRRRRRRMVPHPGPVDGEQPSIARSGALRAAIFGMNDGLVSNLSLIFGVAGAGVQNRVLIITGIAGLLAGAFSMAAGEYISMKVQREVFERLIHLEAHEIATQPEDEAEELTGIYREKGFPEDLARKVSAEVMRDPKLALETHAKEELGLDPDEGLGSPWAAAGSSFAMFAVGAVVPLLPFLFMAGGIAVATSAVLGGVTLFGVGGAMSILTGKHLVLSGIRMLLVGSAAAAITYLVGHLLNVAVS